MSIFLEMMAEVVFVISVLEIPEVILKAVLEGYSQFGLCISYYKWGRLIRIYHIYRIYALLGGVLLLIVYLRCYLQKRLH